MYFVDDTDLGLDYEAYEVLWENVIKPEIASYLTDFDQTNGVLRHLGAAINLLPNIEKMIWDRYCYYNIKCKSEYMDPPTQGTPFLLDRHKVAACYMAAIVSVQPMIIYSVDTKEPSTYPINELLAITVGLSVLRSFIEASDIPEAQKKHAAENILYPPKDMIGHGDYLNNFANELHFAFLDGSINILSISHELFLLEVITRTGVGEFY